MEYGVLGALRVTDGTAVLTPRGQRPRDLLAMLLLRHPNAVDASVLLEGVWGDDAAELAPAVVHTVVARLRRSLGEDQVETSEVGYRLRPGTAVDAVAFADLVRSARALEPAQASESIEVLRTALALWRGDRAFDDVSDHLVTAERQRLDALRATAVESLAESLLTLPDPTGWVEANERAEALIAVDPLRERPYELVMLSAYRAGRQADALSTYTRLRTALRDELGIDPGPGAVDLQRRILEQDPALGGEVRRVWTEPATAPERGLTGAATAGADVPLLFGRDDEVAALTEFVATGHGALVITGPPGIGKTALWESGRAQAPRDQVVQARPGEEEVRYSFSVLADLLDGVDLDRLTELPERQREALSGALVRTDGTSEPDMHAIALGLAAALDELAREAPLLVAVDDVQWMDAESAEALTFASRRVDRNRVRFLLARRDGHDRTALEQAFPAAVRRDVVVAPLDADATAQLLRSLEVQAPARVVRLVHEQSGGNALFIHELAQVLRERGLPEKGQPLGVPTDVEELLGLQVDEVPSDERTAALAVALEKNLTEDVLSTLTSRETVAATVRRRLLVVDSTTGRVRFRHPLIAALARDRSTPAQRRSLHRWLADQVTNPDSRARHLGLGHDQPDEDRAAELAHAAGQALSRRAFETAVELTRLALEQTPSDSPDRPQRIVNHAQALAVAGWTQHLTDFLLPKIDELPVGPRGHAWLMLTSGVVETLDRVDELASLALRDSGEDMVLRAQALSLRASYAAAARVTDLEEAVRWGEEARRLDPSATAGVAWVRAVTGAAIDLDEPDDSEVSALRTATASGISSARAMQHSWRGELAQAREILVREINGADREGRGLDTSELQLHLVEVHVRAGDLTTAEAMLGLWGEVNENVHESADNERMRALIAALRGDPEAAERLAEVALVEADRLSVRWARLEALRARGLGAQFAGRLDDAARDLGAVWSWCEDEGVADPGTFPVVGDLVSALVSLDRVTEAEAVLARLATLSVDQQHPWGTATTTRCQALVGRAAGELDSAEASALLRVAAEEYSRLGMVGDHARTLLELADCLRVSGELEQRTEALVAAADVFESSGATGWAERTRALLAG
ncbi:DNA-binding SARP family transcriptional activator [Marmoricola sp. OAE513]|uniref:BTAD domain-containing putative transcriptional regulator n=1 Tax=Marmoricola sp. OAE513 TaxID=2817894 RepID=UPI001AE6B8ED